MTGKNISYVLHQVGVAKFEDRPAPTIGPEDTNEAVIRIKYVGICGSDVHFWSHDGVGNKLVDDHPIVIGHEASGDQVAIEGSRPCRQCKRCKEGLYNLCPKMKFAACPPDMDGMLAKYFKIPADFCYKLPKGVGLEEGVLVEPLAVAVHAVRMANAQPGQSVAVFGSRTIGVLSAAVTKVYGAGKVVAVDLLDSKFDFAKRFNSSAIFKPNITVPAEVNEARLISENELGIGADAVIGASVAGSSVNTTIHETFMPSALDMTGKILDEFDARHVPSPYAGSENGKAQAFWRTMVCDLRPSGQRQDAGFEGLKRIMQSKDEPDDFQRGQDDYTRALSWQWGYVGIAPWDAEKGDSIFVVDGASVPYLTRREGREDWKLIGECYVHGIMDGEAVGRDNKIGTLAII